MLYLRQGDTDSAAYYLKLYLRAGSGGRAAYARKLLEEIRAKQSTSG